MPYNTLGQIMSLATLRAGRRADLSASDVSAAVNMAGTEVAAREVDASLESVTTLSVESAYDDYLVPLPSGFLEPISVTLIQPSNSTAASAVSSWRTLTPISVAEIDASGSSTTGVPTSFAFYGHSLELFPSPNSDFSLQLRFRQGWAELTEEGDVPSLSTPWRQAVLYKTEEHLHRILQDGQGEALAQRRYLDYVSSLKDDRARRQMIENRQGISLTAYGNRGRRRT